MKKIANLLCFILFFYCLPIQAADLIEVYIKAQAFDPAFQREIARRYSVGEDVPISLSALLPNLGLVVNPAVQRTSNSGVNYISPFLNPRNYSARTYAVNLSVTQTVFNFAQFFNLSSSIAKSKEAEAALNAALQDLMFRVAKAYFTILKDEENVRYSEQSKNVYAKQLRQVQAQLKTGVSTITDVETAKASYNFAVSNHLGSINTLENDREKLREMTGVLYTHLEPLSKRFPTVSPQPNDVTKWTEVALAQNWTIKSVQHRVHAALQTLRQQQSGHLPTLSMEGNVSKQYVNNINGYPSINAMRGAGTTANKEVALVFNLPIYSGGQVTALSNQARYDYDAARQELEQSIQGVLSQARQNFHTMTFSISRINADVLAVTASQRSYHGMEVSFKVGIQSLIDLLNQQQKVYQAQLQYANDRYEYVISMVALKQAAGTLSFNDLQAINNWLK